MDEIKPKIILDDIIAINKKVLTYKVDPSQKGYFILMASKIYQEVIKIFGREAVISKEFRRYLEVFRQPKYFNADLINQFITRINYLSTILSELSLTKEVIPLSHRSQIPTTKNVFIIHGHDEPNTLKLYILLRDEFRLNPIKISSKPGQSRSIIDKFEVDASTCSFAFAIYSRDDEVVKSQEQYLQARPNVFFESGWFTGRLGKDRLLILLQNGTKIHSDFDGISRIQYDNDINDKFIQIRDELLAANMITV